MTERFEYGECHMHIFMNGVDYRKAVWDQEHGRKEEVIRRNLEEYRKKGITWIRDGGDRFGTSDMARELAPAYGITYRTPLFAIHKEGHYGGIVGKSFRDLREYRELVREVRRRKGNFIKIMISGIMDFQKGGLTEDSLKEEEITDMIHIAHDEGFSVMAHTNGSRAAVAAIEAGVDSMEHGNFMNQEAICALAESGTVWVPTVVTVKNLLNDGRFPGKITGAIWEGQKQNLRDAFLKGARIALGSDAGAYRVLHGQGLLDEYAAFQEVLGDLPDWEQTIQNSDRILRSLF